MLEDIFLEELVDAPNDIEHVIEDGAEDIQNGSGRESGNEDENSKDKVKVKRKLGPRPTLNAERLKGPRGIGIMESFFSDINLQGNGQEKEDLDLVIGRLEHWAHRLHPRMQFDEALKKIEKLGSKKEISNYVKRIRLGLEDDMVSGTGLEDEPPPPVDSFDQLLVPAAVPAVVPAQPTATEMTVEQRERMLQNRLMAEERRKVRIKRAQELKETFQVNQAPSQCENSQAAELGPIDTTQGNEVQGNNQHEVEMEIDENQVLGVRSEADGNHVYIRLENQENVGDFQIERKDNQSDLVEGNENNLARLMQAEDIEEEDVPMEGI